MRKLNNYNISSETVDKITNFFTDLDKYNIIYSTTNAGNRSKDDIKRAVEVMNTAIHSVSLQDASLKKHLSDRVFLETLAIAVSSSITERTLIAHFH
jgi:pimeloyl-CoA synthetase